MAVRVESFSRRVNPLANTGTPQMSTVHHITDPPPQHWNPSDIYSPSHHRTHLLPSPTTANTGTPQMSTVYYHRQQKRSSSCSCSWQLDLATSSTSQSTVTMPLSPCTFLAPISQLTQTLGSGLNQKATATSFWNIYHANRR